MCRSRRHRVLAAGLELPFTLRLVVQVGLLSCLAAWAAPEPAPPPHEARSETNALVTPAPLPAPKAVKDPEDWDKQLKEAQALVRRVDPADQARGTKAIHTLAKAGHGASQFVYASLCETGAVKDEAAWWFCKSCDSGYEPACERLRRGVRVGRSKSENSEIVNGVTRTATAEFGRGTVSLVKNEFRLRSGFSGSVFVWQRGFKGMLLLKDGMTTAQTARAIRGAGGDPTRMTGDEWRVGDSVLIFIEDRLRALERPYGFTSGNLP